MSGVIRILALQKLADFIAEAIPALQGKICGGAAEAPHKLGFPSLGIFAIRFRFFPDQATLHAGLETTRAVFNVGRVEGTVQLRLGASTPQRRYQLEQELMEKVFWANEERPGIVVLEIPECDDALIAFELDQSEWEDERAFDKKWFSVMTATLQMPALVAKGSVYDMEEVRLTLTDDLSTPIVSVADSSKETVSIDEDGNMTPVESP